MLDAKLLRQLIRCEERGSVVDRAPFQFRVEHVNAEGEVLDAAFAKLDVRVADTLRHDWRIPARDLEHLVGHINADDFSFRPHHLRGDETNLSSAASEIEHRLAFPEISARIAATVIAFDDFLRNDLEVFRVVIDRATKFRFRGLRSSRVTFPDF